MTGLTELFQVKNVKKIHPAVKKLWKVEVPYDHQIWNHIRLEWKPGWTGFFNENIAVNVGSRMEFQNTLKSGSSIKYFLNLPTERSEAKALLEWKFALNLISRKKMKLGTDVLAWLLDHPEGFVSRDLVNLTIARLLFDAGADKSALIYYKKVNFKSPYWLFARGGNVVAILQEPIV